MEDRFLHQLRLLDGHSESKQLAWSGEEMRCATIPTIPTIPAVSLSHLTQARRDQRSGSYDRKLQTKAGAVTLKVPKLRRQTFETAIIERYRWRESSG